MSPEREVSLSLFQPPGSFCPRVSSRGEAGWEHNKIVQSNNSNNIYYATLLCPRHCSKHFLCIWSTQLRALATCVPKKTSCAFPASFCLSSLYEVSIFDTSWLAVPGTHQSSKMVFKPFVALMKNCPLIRLATSEPNDESSHHRRGTARPVRLSVKPQEALGPSKPKSAQTLSLITSLQDREDKGHYNDLVGVQWTQSKMWEILPVTPFIQ